MKYGVVFLNLQVLVFSQNSMCMYALAPFLNHCVLAQSVSVTVV